MPVSLYVVAPECNIDRTLTFGNAEGYRLEVLRVFPELLRQTLGDPGLSDVEALSQTRNHCLSMLRCLEHGLEVAG